MVCGDSELLNSPRLVSEFESRVVAIQATSCEESMAGLGCTRTRNELGTVTLLTKVKSKVYTR